VSFAQHETAPAVATDDLHDTVIEEGSFRAGAMRLFRRSVRPASGAWARLGLLHGYGDHSGRHLHAMRWLAGRGVVCHALDFRGHGLSEGRRGYVRRWEEYLDDLDAFLATDELRPSPSEGAPFLLGHSHGALVLAAAGIRGGFDAAGCILTAPYFRSSMHVPWPKVAAARLLTHVAPWAPVPNGLKDEWMSSDPSMVEESGRDPLVVRNATPRWYVTMLRAQEEVLRRAPEFRLPLLVLMGDRDPIADPAAADEFRRAAGSGDARLLRYPEYLHELLREAEREVVLRAILEWLRDRAATAAA
jgi:alpha-beta hydrolase superfamily lysophospholipase